MSAIRFLAADKLASWLAEVAASRQVLAPRQEGKAVVFRPLVAGETPSLARATISPKAAVFPACETLVHFTGTKDPENPAKLNMKLDDTPDAPARMVFGCRSCDARGFAVLDKPFLEGKFQDAYYKARRDNLLVVTRTCDSPCSTCFCHWTGGGPADPTGSDVLLTAVNGGFVLEAVSEKGEAFLASTKLADGSDKMDEAKAAREATTAAGAAFNRRLLPVSTGTPEPCVEDPLSDPDSLSDAGVGKAFGPQFEGTNTAILLRLRRDLAGIHFFHRDFLKVVDLQRNYTINGAFAYF